MASKNSASGAGRPPVAKSSDHTQHPEPPTKITHRGITYTSLSESDQAAVAAGLPRLCHSVHRLSKEGYTFTTNKVAGTGTLAIPEQEATTFESISAPSPKPVAVVLDCEMAGTATGGNELIQIAVIDFLSGKVLLQSLVNPTVPIRSWRTHFTNITKASMEAAVARNEALEGWQAARTELLRVIGPDTILIGQSLHHDLKVLHTSHAKIIDTAILAFDAALGEAMADTRKRWGLQELCRDLLRINIRKYTQRGVLAVVVHDALEDVLATRDLVLCFLRSPGKVTAWAKAARIEHNKKDIDDYPTPGELAAECEEEEARY